MIFYLQHGNTETEVAEYRRNARTTLSDPRDFIDDHLHVVDTKEGEMATSKLVAEIEAADWRDARALA